MGIQGLLPFLRKASREANLKDFKGQTAAIDAYCWLHKGAFSCADKLVRGEPTDGYVVYVMKQINQLLNNDIKPILVFDGCHLPSKAITETKRRENRERNRKKAKELLREGKIREAKECFQRCVDVTSEMAADVINACRARNVDIIVAPYEADSQLAYLNHRGIAQLVITEDSDLVLFGCKACLFKLDNNGGCVLVEQEKLHLAMNVPRDKFCFDKFRNMCILSGCDYLPSLHGIGLAKACKFFNVISNPDIYNALCKLPSYLRMPHLEVTKEYRDNFVKARNTFLYQLVFDPIDRILRPLNDYPDDLEPEDLPYAGKFIGHERALQIALGNINVQTGEVVGNFSPETYKPPEPKSSGWNKRGNICSAHPSIWTKSFTKNGPVVPSIANSERQSMKHKEVTVMNPIFKRRKPETEVVDNDVTERELHDLYSQPEKRRKIEVCPDDAEKSKTVERCPDDTEIALDNSDHTALDQLSDSLDMDEDTKINLIFPVEKDQDTSAETQLDLSSDQSKSRNPFAKSRSTSKLPGSGGQFSALKRFSKIKKTVIDKNTIVQSRYFASPGLKTSPTAHVNPPIINSSPVENTVKPENQRTLWNIENQEMLDNKLEIKVEISSSEIKNAPLSPVQTNLLPAKPKKTFQWGKLSEMFACTKEKSVKVENSAATRNAFKPVTEHRDKLACKQDTLTSSQSSDSEECSLSQRSQVSEMSLYSDVGSVDNESFGMTPSSLPSTPDAATASQPAETVTSPVLTSPVIEKKTTTSLSRSRIKCRTPGLSRHSSEKNKKQLHAKQLSLTEMFAYKKDGAKV
ncbi:exonuclease 1 [Procambarus clarkii]|uniref:exonuclease 1 n=1 Tax=Procambarus clarkii TaxID=6728 RepID=UPI001E671E86|nr:exonuclease 1-like [Procambarus clarkii]